MTPEQTELRKRGVTLEELFKNVKPPEPRPRTQPLPNRTPNPDIKIYHGDFNIVGQQIPDNSIDAIITDPMYYHAMLHTWDELGALAKRLLKPSGFCVGYSGILHIPEVLEAIGKHLEYYTIVALKLNGEIETIEQINMKHRWKPIVVYQKPPRKVLDVAVEDLIVNDSREKNLYEFQQGLMGVKSCVDVFSKPGDLVLEPMMGSGTTVIAGYQLKRKVIGIEIQPTSERDANVFENAYARIQKETCQEPEVHRSEQ